MIDVSTHRAFWTVHKYAGLTACVWLFVVAVTGIFLDHHEWRWLNQNSVPSSLTSTQIDRLVPGTVMRHIAVTENAILGASERGTWLSRDKGKTWRSIRFEAARGTPMVLGIAGTPQGTFSGVYLATDDGLWAMDAGGDSAQQVALKGEILTAISPGHDAGSLVAVRDHSELLTINLSSRMARPIPVRSSVSGLSPDVPFNNYIREIHFGRGLLPGQWSVWLNDIGGFGLAILAFTGLAYWGVRRAGKALPLSVPARRGIVRWLFRGHGPIIGLIALIPIFYLAATAIPLNHIYGFITSTKGWTVSRASLPPAYQGRSLDHEIDGVAAWPGQPGRLFLGTRYGVLESLDNGRTWTTGIALPGLIAEPGGNVFRTGDRIFAGFGGAKNYVQYPGSNGWQKIDGPKTAITSAAQLGDQWFIKNSKAIYVGAGDAAKHPESGITFKHAVAGTSLFLFMADVHTGVIFHNQFKWLNDLFAGLAVALVISGPVIWWRRKWA